MTTRLEEFFDYQQSCNKAISLSGTLIRKRKLSKRLVFGDLLLDATQAVLPTVPPLTANVVMEMIFKARSDGSDEGMEQDQLVLIDQGIDFGDIITVSGRLYYDQRRDREPELIFRVQEIVVNEAWRERQPGVPFTHTDEYLKLVAHASSTPSKASGSRIHTNSVEFNGQEACKYWFSASKPACFRGDACQFFHGAVEEFQRNREIWLQRRESQRVKAATIPGDPHASDEKHLKSHRAQCFAKFLIDTYGLEYLQSGSGVLDIAGGKGDLSFELWNKYQIPTTLIDPRQRKVSKSQRKYLENEKGDLCLQIRRCFDMDLAEDYPDLIQNASLIVGLHPDEATEPIVDCALQFHIPYAIIPCCVMSRVYPDRKDADGNVICTYETFLEYLDQKTPSSLRTFLPFHGRNQVLYTLPS